MVVPLRTDVPTRRVPWVVIGLVAANLGVFAYVLGLGDDAASAVFDRYGLVPRELLRGASPLSPLTCMFLHGSVLHLAGNLVYLWIFGARIEELLGSARFVVFYAACGLVAGAIHVASDPGSWLPTVGASGAISGLLGAYAVSYPTGRLRLLWPPVRVPAFAFLGLWIGVQVASGLGSSGQGAGGTAWWAHVGGFAAGAALARSMWLRPPTRARLRI
ncbi:MAG: rhomboid family intramembrane serine protease [Myxococcota bacterium]